MNPIRILLLMLILSTLLACGGPDHEATSGAAAETAATVAQSAAAETPGADSNPFFELSTLALQMPPFDRIQDGHFIPAMQRGMAEQLQEVDQIVSDPAPVTFDNTLVALERSGQLLNRVVTVFFNLTGADTNEQRQAIQREMSPQLAAHQDAIQLDPRLFARIDALFQRRDSLGLDAEQLRLLDKVHRDFVRAGAQLADEHKARLREINAELARLGTAFSQNVLQEVNDSAIVIDTVAELEGMSQAQIQAAADEAGKRGLTGKYVLNLMNFSGQPQLALLTNRGVRERLMQASLVRGGRGNEFDNREIVAQVVALRAEKANMLGYATHADFVLEENTAKTVAAVADMLGQLTPVAVANARREGRDLQALIDQTENPSFELRSWDWPYYTEKLRQQKYAFDAGQIKPYFELDSVVQNGVFFAAEKLYGITFKERHDLPVYHPDVRVFDVFDSDGAQLAIFMGDYYARPSKRGGAWMNAYVSQSGLLGTRPVVGNHLNIPKPPEGQPTLLTLDEVTTLFHEFGHALHGMFSNVTYPTLAGTSVPRDFVEYPSQVNEMWALWPEILQHYALHYETGERIPQALLDRVVAADKFNEGYRTTEYLAASILDMCLHTLGTGEVPAADEILQLEDHCLEQAGIAYEPVPPRYRTLYFSHIMGGYSAGYYSYIWSEVLDAETVQWMQHNGGLKRANGDHFRSTLLSRGDSKDALDLFRDFAGKDPDITPLLERRGLVTAPAPSE